MADQLQPPETPSDPRHKQHTIGEGTAVEKSGGPTKTGDPDAHQGTTPGSAEGTEADIDQALEQQRGQVNKPR